MASTKISGLAEQTAASETDLVPVSSSTGAAKKMTISSLGIGVESTDYPGCYYRTVDGEKEWLNPPLILGTEYRTPERYNGKVVYTKLVDCGTAADGKQVALHGFYETIRFDLNFKGYHSPYINGGALDNAYTAYASVQHSTLTMRCGSSIVGRQCYCQVWYYKENAAI